MNFFDLSKPLPPLPTFTPKPTLRISFDDFINLNYRQGPHNLYIVWKGKQALYVGIARDSIWIRWFQRGGQSHMYFAQKYSGTREGGSWQGLSPVGRVIACNMPKSLKWTIELRHCSPFDHDLDNVERTEPELIQSLRPLFNGTYRPSFTEKERRLRERLINARNF